MLMDLSMDEWLKILADRTEDVGTRDDIVMFLFDDGDERALEILHDIASNPQNGDDVSLIKGGCGETIGAIMCRIRCFDMKYINGLLPYYWGSPLHSVLEAIKACNLKWYEENNLEELYKTPVIKKIKTPAGEF